MKHCARCGVLKALEEFPNKGRSKFGYVYRGPKCWPCVLEEENADMEALARKRERQRRYEAANPGRQKLWRIRKGFGE
jgi:hypothetical protein